MGLWATIRDALGLQRPLQVLDHTAPLELTAAAVARLDGMAEGQGIHLSTSEVPGGRIVTVTEGELQGPSAPGFEAWPITSSDVDLQRLRGRTLDVRDDRWAISFPLELRARDTPNPDGRLYLTSTALGEGRPAFFTPPTDEDLPARLLAIPSVVSVLFRDNTVTVERAPGAPWDPIDKAVDAALREHFLLCGQPVAGAEASSEGGALEAAVRQILDEQVAPAIHRDGGDIELVGVSNGVVKVSMMGACRSCPASQMTLQNGVERALKEALPGQIERVEQV